MTTPQCPRILGWPADPQELKELNETLVARGRPPWTPYTGSIIDQCQRCDRKVYLGPRQQHVKNEYPEAEIVCLFCLNKDPNALGVISLGNEEKRIERN